MITTTRKEAITLIEESINNVIPLQDDRLEKVIYAVNNDLTVRDWVLGMPLRFTLEESIDFVRYMAVHTTALDSVPFITINAVFEYERGNLDKSIRMLEYVNSVNNEYSLAMLITRTIDANLAPEMFNQMRKELDAQVLQDCNEQPIREEDN
jgi:hypothetical protein